MSVPSIITEQSVSVYLDGKMHVVDTSHANFEKVKEALRKGASAKEITKLVDIAATVRKWGAGKILVEGGRVFVQRGLDKVEVKSALVTRILTMIREGFDPLPMIRFMNKLYDNPSKRAIDELFGFLERNNLPITDDGDFLAYKRVRFDYTDIHSGRFSNHVGAYVSMTRGDVDDDKNRTCSQGLHFCSAEYLPHFGGYGGNRVVILSINPKDVVSIPVDYNNAKGRCCAYKVVDEETGSEGSVLETGPIVRYTPGVTPSVDDEPAGNLRLDDAYGAGYDAGDEDSYNNKFGCSTDVRHIARNRTIWSSIDTATKFVEGYYDAQGEDGEVEARGFRLLITSTVEYIQRQG